MSLTLVILINAVLDLAILVALGLVTGIAGRLTPHRSTAQAGVGAHEFRVPEELPARAAARGDRGRGSLRRPATRHAERRAA
jgi:hypothetical protein